MMFRTLMIVAMSMLMVACACKNGWAQAANYTFDKAHTQILFNINHLGFSQSYGEFLDYDGTIMFDEDAPETGSVDVTIKTASIDMDDEKWDEHLKDEDYFNVEKFPDMTFKSTAITRTGDNTADMVGDLTILGVTQPVTLAVTHNKSGKHAFSGKYVSGFSATGIIKRSDFGMKKGLPLVSDDVNLILEVEAIREETGGEGTGNK